MSVRVLKRAKNRDTGDAIVLERDTYDYNFTEWIYGNAALFPEDEPSMYLTIPLDSVEVADEHLHVARELVTVE